MNIITGNLLEADDDIICHQCNCVTDGAAGIAAAIFKEFPWSDVYSRRAGPFPEFSGRSAPGTIEICGDGIMERYVVAMYAQIYPGRPKPPSDSEEQRLLFFQSCLDALAEKPGIKNGMIRSIGFPWQIGCGLAAGDWEKYSSLLHEFSGLVKADVNVYQLA
jgi:O-acetyl-ADP-ribose deacetylase (regulator of RNase III)